MTSPSNDGQKPPSDDVFTLMLTTVLHNNKYVYTDAGVSYPVFEMFSHEHVLGKVVILTIRGAEMVVKFISGGLDTEQFDITKVDPVIHIGTDGTPHLAGLSVRRLLLPHQVRRGLVIGAVSEHLVAVRHKLDPIKIDGVWTLLDMSEEMEVLTRKLDAIYGRYPIEGEQGRGKDRRKPHRRLEGI